MLHRYDLLTTLVAVLTVSTWSLGWMGYTILGALWPAPYLTVLAAWGVFVLWGAFLWFRPQLAFLWRRAATAVE
jgi:hypothetical protein